MSSYVIVTDSSCDLPAAMVEELGIQVVPLAYMMEDRTYLNYPDHREMSSEAFYEKIAAGVMATTNAVNVGQAVEAVEPHLKAGLDVLILAFSSGLSTTYNSFRLAADELAERYPQRRVYAVDTLCASLGQGMLVHQAVALQKAGKTIEEVRDWAEDAKYRQAHWFTVNDLFHLKRGGRVSAATAVVGSMLQIKPVLHMDDAGRLINMSKARGRRAALLALVDHAVKDAVDPQEQTMFICHSACPEDAQLVADEVRRRLNVKDIIIGPIGPVIGAHTGVGCVSLFYMGTGR